MTMDLEWCWESNLCENSADVPLHTEASLQPHLLILKILALGLREDDVCLQAQRSVGGRGQHWTPHLQFSWPGKGTGW